MACFDSISFQHSNSMFIFLMMLLPGIGRAFSERVLSTSKNLVFDGTQRSCDTGKRLRLTDVAFVTLSRWALSEHEAITSEPMSNRLVIMRSLSGGYEQSQRSMSKMPTRSTRATPLKASSMRPMSTTSTIAIQN